VRKNTGTFETLKKLEPSVNTLKRSSPWGMRGKKTELWRRKRKGETATGFATVWLARSQASKQSVKRLGAEGAKQCGGRSRQGNGGGGKKKEGLGTSRAALIKNQG